MNTPKISVIVPVYGVEKYIERCAVSLFEQTLEDIEYIFVDDCSPDNSIELLRQVLAHYTKRVSQTKIVRMPVNSGQAAVRKYGISLATGEYLIHCDSDDWVERNMYERLYDVAKSHDYDIVICDYFNSRSEQDFDLANQQVSSEKEQLLRDLLNETVHGALWNKLIKRKLYENVLYPTDNLREDLTLIIQIVYFSNRIKYIAEPYYHYFYNNESITNKSESLGKMISKLEQSVNNYKIMELFMRENCILEYFHKEVFNMQCRLKVGALIYIFTDGGYKKWEETFPMINFSELMRSNLNVFSKIGCIFAKLRLYPIYWYLKKIIR